MIQLPPDGDAEGDEARLDRLTPPGPVRVARLDALRPAGGGAEGAGASRIARLEGIGTESGEDTAQSSGARVVGFDELKIARRRREAGEPRTSARRDRRSRSGDSQLHADASAPIADVAATLEAADIPLDGPLPGSRRRRAAARPGRAARAESGAPINAGGLVDPGGPVDSGAPTADSTPADPDPEPPADPVAIAREICLRLLTDRARTRQELADALARKGVPAEAAAAVLDRFDEVGLIDDAAFAGQWVRSRHRYRGLGRRAIAVELRRKGVADEVAGEALAEIDAESEDRRARELVDRKLRSLTVVTTDQRAAAARRLVGMLARKGYSAGTAYRVVREVLAERSAEHDEWDADGSAEE